MHIMYNTGRAFFRIFFRLICGLRVSGLEHFPKTGGVMVASNHISYYDPPLVGSAMKRAAYFLAKQELFKNRFIGWVLRRVLARPVKRGSMDRRAMEMVIEWVNAGEVVTLFPEGTRSRTGAFLPPKAGIGLMAHRAKCPIVPVYISGSDHLKDCFKRRRRLTVRFGEPISPDWIAAQTVDKAGYEVIAQTVMKRIGDLKEQSLRGQ